jgi:pilus assembly protein Flp/PilA
MKKLMKFFKDEEGVTAIEYGLIAAGIGVAIVTTVGLVGDELVTLFETVVTELGGTLP